LKNGQDVELGILGDLHQLFILSTPITQEATNRKTSLDALKFKRMKARFSSVFTSTDTFEWCLQPEKPPNHPDL